MYSHEKMTMIEFRPVSVKRLAQSLRHIVGKETEMFAGGNGPDEIAGSIHFVHESTRRSADTSLTACTTPRAEELVTKQNLTLTVDMTST